jgi:hypothetical protein
VNAVLTWLATKPAWAINLTIWVLLAGVTGAALRRVAEILGDDDGPLPVPVPAVPVTLDLGPFPIDLTTEHTS